MDDTHTSTEIGSNQPSFDINTLDLETELAVELAKLIAIDDPDFYHLLPTHHQADAPPAPLAVNIYNDRLPTAIAAGPSPPQPTFWDILPTSSSPLSSPSLPQSPILTLQPTVTVTSPTPAAAAAAQEEEVLVYYFSLLPEKGKTIWVVFFHPRLHSLADFELRLTNTDTAAAANCRELALEANTALSWTATDPVGGPMRQYKVAFDCPNTTYERAAFRARLVNEASGLALDLGPFSIVSTTSQRTNALARLERGTPLTTRGSSAYRKLIVNFKTHPSSKRHHINGKGGKQRNLRGLRFLHDELDKAGAGVPGTYCLGLYMMDGLGVIIGDIFMQRYHVAFDKNLDRIGFAPINTCPTI